MGIKKALLLVMSACTCLAVSRVTGTDPDYRDVMYGDHRRNVLDLWLAKTDEAAPLVLFFHGGGFRSGDKSMIDPRLVKSCLESGVSVAAVNYRFYHHAPFPAQMHDAARAVQFLRYKSQEYNLDPGRFAATGGSAGGGISLWLAFHDDLKDKENEDPVKRFSSRILTAAVLNAQCSYDPRWIKENIGGQAHNHPALKPFFGITDGELDSEKAYKLYEEASPITHLSKDDPDVYMYFVGKDKPSNKPGAGIHSEIFGYKLREKMKQAGLKCYVSVGAGGNKYIDFLIAKLTGKEFEHADEK